MYNKIIKIVMVFLATFFGGNLASAKVWHKHKQVFGVERSSLGKPSLESRASKHINVVVSDNMKFTFPNNIELKNGETITFIVTNNGKLPHEFSIGNEKEQKAHQLMMKNNPKMVHNDGNTITIKPGETNSLTWKFKGNGTVIFSCNIPGHFEAGMYKKLQINPTK